MAKKEKNKKYALGGKSQLGNTPTGYGGSINALNPAPDIFDKDNYQKGGKLEGMLKGPSHERGGIKFALGNEIQEAEGGEFVVRKEAVEQLKKMYGKGVFDDFINKGMLPPNRKLT